MERYLIALALSLLTQGAHAGRCEKNPRHKDEKRCENVYCGAYKFARCVNEICCTWIVDIDGDDAGEIWFEPGEGG